MVEKDGKNESSLLLLGHINSLITWSILWHRHLWFLLCIFLEVACFYHSGALLLEVEDAVKSAFIAVPVKYGSTKLGPSWPRNDSLSRWVMYWPVCCLANRALSPLAVARRQMADKWAVFSGRACVQTSGLGPWFCGSRPGSYQVASGPPNTLGYKWNLIPSLNCRNVVPLGYHYFIHGLGTLITNHSLVYHKMRKLCLIVCHFIALSVGNWQK